MLIIGHRGAKGLAPENTIASLQAALDAGVDGIEFDVRVSRDNVAVLNHNSDIGVPGFDLDIAKTNYNDLKKAKPTLITLDEALDFINNRVKIVIEIKLVRSVQPIVDCINKHLAQSWTTDTITISSFNMRTLKQIRGKLPQIELSVNEAWSGVRATHRARTLGTKRITMNQEWLWSGFISSLAKNGYILTAYTVNDPDKAKRWQKYNLYAVVTDYPDRFN